MQFQKRLLSYLPLLVCLCSVLFALTPDASALSASNDFEDFYVTDYGTCANCKQLSYLQVRNVSGGCGGRYTTTLTCTNCSYVKSTTVNSSGEHSWKRKSVYSAPSCLKDREDLFYCVLCVNLKHEPVAGTALGHDWTETSSIPATCITVGSVSSSCSRCSETKTDSLSALDHNWLETSCTPAACLTPGSIDYACSRCTETKTETIPQLAADHTWTETSRTDATCTADGSAEYDCSVCHEVKTEILPSLGHDWEEIGYTPPTCTEDGSVRRSCTRCGFSASEKVPALGSTHAWQETDRKEPTEVFSGFVEYTCSVCGSVRREKIPASGSAGSMTELLAMISNVITAVLGWFAVVSETIWRNPILLILVIIGFLSTGILLFKRLLNL